MAITSVCKVSIYLGLDFDRSTVLAERWKRRLQTIYSDCHVTVLRVTAQVYGIIPRGVWSDLVVLALKFIAV